MWDKQVKIKYNENLENGDITFPLEICSVENVSSRTSVFAFKGSQDFF